jgi:Flp pilus assembly pilin Flp
MPRFALRWVVAIDSRRSALARFIARDHGQDLIEYALLAGFVGIAGWLALSVIDEAVGNTYLSWIDPAAGAPSLWDPGTPLGSGS